jgi:hypothetical protein
VNADKRNTQTSVFDGKLVGAMFAIAIIIVAASTAWFKLADRGLAETYGQQPAPIQQFP